jgi:hypothetical protein
MLLRCEANITQEQINVLQKYKLNPESFDALKEEFANLVTFDFKDFDNVGNDMGKPGRVNYDNAEATILR